LRIAVGESFILDCLELETSHSMSLDYNWKLNIIDFLFD